MTFDKIDMTVVIRPEGEVGSFGEPLLINALGSGPVDTTAPVITLIGLASVAVEIRGGIPKPVRHQMEGKL